MGLAGNVPVSAGTLEDEFETGAVDKQPVPVPAPSPAPVNQQTQNPGAAPVQEETTQRPAPAPADVSLELTDVIFNGRALTRAELAELQALYKVKARAGKYWYDAKSGLYGKIGWAASGFMYPGHNLGPLASNASRGTTGIYINGRNVTTREVYVLSQLAGVPIARGHYWLDASGNAGYEGNASPVINLFASAQAQSRSGGGGGGNGGGGGDGFWSTRFSAGNSSGGSGYVSLPGGGFVSY